MFILLMLFKCGFYTVATRTGNVSSLTALFLTCYGKKKVQLTTARNSTSNVGMWLATSYKKCLTFPCFHTTRKQKHKKLGECQLAKPFCFKCEDLTIIFDKANEH